MSVLTFTLMKCLPQLLKPLHDSCSTCGPTDRCQAYVLDSICLAWLWPILTLVMFRGLIVSPRNMVLICLELPSLPHSFAHPGASEASAISLGSSTACTFDCQLDPRGSCGGLDANSLYRLPARPPRPPSPPPPPPAPTFTSDLAITFLGKELAVLVLDVKRLKMRSYNQSDAQRGVVGRVSELSFIPEPYYAGTISQPFCQ